MRVKHYESLLWLSRWHNGRAQQLLNLHQSHVANIHQLVLDELDGAEYQRATLNFDGLCITLSCDVLGPQLVSVGRPRKLAFQKELLLPQASGGAAFQNGLAKLTKVKLQRRRIASFITPGELSILESQHDGQHTYREREAAAMQKIVPVSYAAVDSGGQWLPVEAARDSDRRDIQLFGLYLSPHRSWFNQIWLTSLLFGGYGYMSQQGERIDDWQPRRLRDILLEMNLLQPEPEVPTADKPTWEEYAELEPPFYDPSHEEEVAHDPVA